MPKWYRLNASGSWGQLSKVYRLNASGSWGNLKTIYRLNASGSWGVVHSSQAAPEATTSPTLTNQNSSSTLFYGGDTLTLTRGAYTETTADSNTTYRMRIYKGTNSSLPLNLTNWSLASEANYTGANSTSSTTLTYSLTDADAKAEYYLVGEVRVNNDANTSGSQDYDFETASRVLSRISFTVSSLSVTPTDRGGTFSWTVGGVADSTYIYSQTLTVRETGPSGTIIKTESISPGTTTTTISDSVNFNPSTLYYALIEVVANDGWKTTGTPNSLSDDEYFNTLSASPVNTVAPTIGPLNNRGYLPVSTTLTATTGTWSNVSGTTGYAYDWWIEDSATNITSNTGYISNNTRSYTTSDVSDYLFVRVRATNADGGVGTAVSPSYTLDQAVAVGNVSPTSATLNVSTNFSFSISHYPTSYVVDWGDGSSNSYSVSANTSTVNATIAHTYTSTGNKTVTVTAQPGNKTSTTTISVTVPAPSASSFSRFDSTTTPSTPSTISFSSSNNQVTSSWTNGSPITSVRFQGSGAGVSTDYTDTSSPFMTSDLSNYSSSGTYTATVTNYNNNLQVTASWNQSNTASYTLYYSSSVFGADSISGNASGSSVSVPISWSSGSGSFTFTGLTVYSGANQTGTSTFYSTGLSAITPTQKSSSRSNSTSLTYTAPNLTAPSIYFVSQSTPGGPLSVYFTGGSGPYYQIWWQSSSNYSSVTGYDASGSSSPVTDTTGASSAGTWYVAVRSVSSPGNTGSGPSSTISSWSTPVQFTVTATTYTVTWNANGGSVSPSSSSGTSGTVVYAPTPTRSGYTFLYWRDTPSGDYTYQINAGGSWTISGNITFYARWQASGGSAPATPTGFSISGSGFASWNASTGATSYTLEYYLATNSAGASADGPFYYYPTGTSQQISYQTIGGVYHNYVRGRIRAENGQSSSYTAWYPTSTTYV